MIGRAQLVLFIIILVIVVHESTILVSAHFCLAETSCAKGVEIVEPFWIDDGSVTEDCSNYPGFEVKCGIDGTPVINISNAVYTLLGIHYGYIRVREAGISGQECPQPQLNFSTGSTPFLTPHSPDNNMTIFYNCSSAPPNIEAQEIPCLKKYYNNSTDHSYAFHGDQIPISFDWYRNCEKSVFTYIGDDSSSNVEALQQALQQGFYLDYKEPVSCRNCESSGGRCSSSETTGAITCHCPGNVKKVDDVCPKEPAGFCRTNTSCGDGVKIDVPFWIGDGNLGKGCTNYHGFRVKCASDGTPVINISNGLYTVLSLSHSHYYRRHGIIRVREADINGQECPQPQRNLSIGSPRFLSTSSDRFLLSNGPAVTMRIFYNCSSPPPNIEALEIRCLEKHYNNSTKHSYAFPGDKIPVGFDWHGHCEKNVLTYIQNNSFSNIVEALRQGIQLQWEKPLNCRDCELSGGRCSSNETTFACHCRHYRVLTGDICEDYGLVRFIIYIGLIALGILIVFCMYTLLCIYRKRIYNSITSYWRKKIKGLTNVEVFLENYGYLALQRYTYSDIKKLTNSFKETLGQGGYGSVFKGKLRDGHLVAVKVLNEAKGKGEDFINEVAAIGRTNHVNVVSLLGFCTDKNKRALVYEYMPNGSLERFIYGEKNSSATSPLGREKLYDITLGIARGLEYLHRGCNTRILHLDIKPHNILLDQNFCPRISDFGLAKLCPTKESLVSMVGTRGTPGYIAPEVYCRNFGGVSHKSDVYSYGMMVLEMIGGRKNIDATVENLSEIYFPKWVYTRLERHNIEDGIEEVNIQVSSVFLEDEKMKKMVIVALWCIQPHPGDRPSMSKVVEMLEGNIVELQMPPNPFPDSSFLSSSTS